MKRVGITETILRDAHQSLIATRMTTEEMLPIIDRLDKVGYHSIEAWGGATFDASLRFLNEDPWERLRKIKERTKQTKLQMLIRGQNILGYRNYADDVVKYFVQRSIANGVDILRIFDALNDIRNLRVSIEACKKEGGHAQATICYTVSPAHNIASFVLLAKELRDLGADSICIKDMAGLLLPFDGYNLITAIKEEVDIPIQLHSHYTSGVAAMTYLKAVEAGVDVLDCALSPLSMGTSQPSTEALVAALQSTEFDTELDLTQISKCTEYFKPLREKYLTSGLLNVKMLSVDINTLLYQVPGGMLSNLLFQLKQQNQEDKYDEVLKEIPRVREDLGYPPLVTPTSQIVASQAVLNVISAERYKVVSKEVKGLVRGEYGRTPVPIQDEIKRKIIGNGDVINCRPADLIHSELETFRSKIAEYVEQDEDVLSYAIFDQVAVDFFKYRMAKKYKIDTCLLNAEDKVYPV